MKRVTVIGISHHTASVELRERVAVVAERVIPLLQLLHDNVPHSELVILSTCNRTEVYGVNLLPADQATVQREVFNSVGRDELAEHCYIKRGVVAVRHLFKVASGLDALVVGETEILGQVKLAFARAREAGTVGRLFNMLFREALRSAKRVHSETALSRGRTSVSSLAVQFAEKLFKDFSAKRVMVVGAGEAAEGALKSLVERGVSDIMVVSRSAQRSEEVAERFKASAIALDAIGTHLPGVDIVLSSTAAPHLVISRETVAHAMAGRMARPLLLIDLAMPRDIDPDAVLVKGVHLHDMNSLCKMAEANKTMRREAARAAKAIVREAVVETVAQAELRFGKNRGGV